MEIGNSFAISMVRSVEAESTRITSVLTTRFPAFASSKAFMHAVRQPPIRACSLRVMTTTERSFMLSRFETEVARFAPPPDSTYAPSRRTHDPDLPSLSPPLGYSKVGSGHDQDSLGHQMVQVFSW